MIEDPSFDYGPLEFPVVVLTHHLPLHPLAPRMTSLRDQFALAAVSAGTLDAAAAYRFADECVTASGSEPEIVKAAVAQGKRETLNRLLGALRVLQSKYLAMSGARWGFAARSVQAVAKSVETMLKGGELELTPEDASDPAAG